MFKSKIVGDDFRRTGLDWVGREERDRGVGSEG